MITDIKQKNITNQLNKETLADYWKGYFQYQDKAVELYQLAKIKLIEAVEKSRITERPFIDSQQIIGKILADFSNQHCFHRQFREQLPVLYPNQILGMQLYDIMVNDKDVWIYTETHHAGHLFPHATYFIPPDKA